jgi:hypothetical protein
VNSVYTKLDDSENPLLYNHDPIVEDRLIYFNWCLLQNFLESDVLKTSNFLVNLITLMGIKKNLRLEDPFCCSLDLLKY